MQADRSAVARELGIGMLNLLEQMQPPAIHPSQPGSPDLFEIVGGDAQAANPKDSPEKESPSEQADMQQVNAAMGHLSTGGQVERRKKRYKLDVSIRNLLHTVQASHDITFRHASCKWVCAITYEHTWQSLAIQHEDNGIQTPRLTHTLVAESTHMILIPCRLSPRRLSSCYSRNTSTLHMWQVGLLHLSMRQGARGQLMTWTAPTRRCTNGH